MIEHRSSIKYYNDNLELVKTISMLLENANAFQEKYKTTNYDAVQKIQNHLLNNLEIYHVKEYQIQGKINLIFQRILI